MRSVFRCLYIFLAVLSFSGCVSFPAPPPMTEQPKIAGNKVIVFDGSALGLKVWEADTPAAIIIAVHGMNDYSNAFSLAGEFWAERGISVYAHDQRGFGESPGFGRWAGRKTLIQDLNAVIAAVNDHHENLPVYLLGHSMGAGVVLAAMAQSELNVDGVILASPGVWGSGQMPIFYRTSVNFAATFMPGKTLTGERTDRRSTDNIEILRQMYADPLVIKGTRLDAVLGVVRVMGAAWRASDDVGGEILLLIGERDEIIPVKTMRKAAARLCGNVTVKEYADGWHLLFRDLQAERVWTDVLDWVFPSGGQNGPQVPAKGAGPADLVCASAGERGHAG